MPDIFHQYGGDLAIGQSGDLALANAALHGQQRVLRRLLTNPGDYLWQPGYGAGLAMLVGQPGSAARIRSVIRSQIFQEAAVARQPEPVIDVQARPDGSVTAQVRYGDSTSGQTQILSLAVGGV